MSALLWALVAVPLGTGTLLAAGGRRLDRAANAVAATAATATLGLACAAAALRPSASAPFLAVADAALRVDGLSAVLILTVTAVTLAVIVFSIGDLRPDDARARFLGLLLLFSGAMLVTVTATTLAPLLLAWEVMGATSWALIGYHWHDRARVADADVSFLTTRAGDLGLYLAAGAALAGGVDGLRLDRLDQAGSPWIALITAGVIAAALGKSAQLPFSFWLSRAMEGPSPVSALLHSATMVAAGAYLLLRLHPLLDASGWGQPVVAWAGALTALLLGLVALTQTDLKQLLGASTCAQIGFMVLAAGSGGITGGTTQLVAHAATKSLLFLAAGAWLTALGTKALPRLRGAARRHRVVGATFAVGTLTLAGLPPLSIWAAKDELLAAAAARDAALYAVGLAAAVLSAAYSLKALWYVMRPVPPAAGGDPAPNGGRRVPPLGEIPLVVLACAAAVLGVLVLAPVADALRRTLGTEGEPSPAAWQPALSALTALAAAAFTWWWGNRPVPAPGRRALFHWLHLEDLCRLLLLRPTARLARALAAFDDRVLDGAVHALARGAATAARLARRADDLRLAGAVRAVATGTRRLGDLTRRIQTGLVHQYYALAAAGVVALILLVALVR